jgi:hypothetical protein
VRIHFVSFWGQAHFTTSCSAKAEDPYLPWVAKGGGKQRLTFRMPSRSLIGYHGEFLTDTRGSA